MSRENGHNKNKTKKLLQFSAKTHHHAKSLKLVLTSIASLVTNKQDDADLILL